MLKKRQSKQILPISVYLHVHKANNQDIKNETMAAGNNLCDITQNI